MAQRAAQSRYFIAGEGQREQRIGPEWINKDSDGFYNDEKRHSIRGTIKLSFSNP